jgi:uncharacterized membrane protein
MTNNKIPELSLNKTRLEALSDGVFAIVMTLLVIEIKVPEKLYKVDTNSLLEALDHEKSLFLSYFLTFAILSVLWLSHHFLFLQYAKNIDRTIIQLNTLFLAFLALIPFSSHFLGVYFEQPLALITFGLNVLITYSILIIMKNYILKAEHIENLVTSKRILLQASIRSWISIAFFVLGIIASFFSPYLAITCYLFPVIFNLFPGSLTALEKLFKFEIK